MWHRIDQIRRESRRREMQQDEAILSAHLAREISPGIPLDENHHLLPRAAVVIELFTADHSPSISSLAVFLLDRLLALGHMPLQSLQQLGHVCLQIAAKLHGVGADSMKLPLFTQTIHPSSELIVLNELHWNIVFPTAHTFLQAFCHRFWVPGLACQHAAQTLIQMLAFGDSAAFRPSVLALTVIFLLSEDRLLPDTCMKLIMNSIRHDPERLNQVLQCISRFQILLFGNSQDNKISYEKDFKLCVGKANDSPMSDTTAYPDSETTDSSWDDILG